jgi:hypothetical protein
VRLVRSRVTIPIAAAVLIGLAALVAFAGLSYHFSTAISDSIERLGSSLPTSA